MKKKNWLVIGLTAAAIAIILAASFLIPKKTPVISDGAPTLSPSAVNTQTPSQSSTPLTVTTPGGDSITPTLTPEATQAPIANAYLVVTVGSTVYQPIPLYEEGDYVINQKDSGARNIIHVTTDSVCMASSTCDNQLCVEQGTVTLDNQKDRALGNMIICLPNEVALELYSRQEMIDLISAQAEATE